MKIIKKLNSFKVLIECSVCKTHVIKDYYNAKNSNTGDQCRTCSNALTNTSMFDRDSILEILEYDPLTGFLHLKRNQRTKKKGDVVGHKHNEGYLTIAFKDGNPLVHRLIWFMVTGEYPEQIDHINHIRDDNRLVNLRDVKSRENQLNMSKRKSKLEIQGIRQLPSGKYSAYIMVQRKQISLGSYIELDDAVRARKEAELLYGFHKNHGR